MNVLEVNNVTVAIDGPASSGKSSVAKRIAKDLGFVYVDTGAMYRTLTYKVLEKGVDVQDESAILSILNQMTIQFKWIGSRQAIFADEEDVTDLIRQNNVSNAVSDVSAHARVRKEMVKRQQKIADKQSIIMDGRDIGTIVLPQADVKIFLVASVKERAERRHKENIQKGIPSNLNLLTEEIKQRDYKDSNRKVSPLKQAKDAIRIDTTELSIHDVVEKIKKLIEERIQILSE